MDKRFHTNYLVVLYIMIASCSVKNTPKPIVTTTTTTPTQSTTLNVSVLTGWWTPTASNAVDKAELYFGTDQFYFMDTVKSQPPAQGFWKPVVDSIYIGPTQTTLGELVYFVKKLTADSLVFTISGPTLHSYVKINKSPITSPAISTVAGSSSGPGYYGNGGLAIQAGLYGQGGIIVDQQGNILFVDHENSVIRKITMTTGIITTIAGTGSTNPLGFVNGIAATAENLVNPEFLNEDLAGNIYFTEGTGGNRVDKISAADGTITCLAGNLAFPGADVGGFSGDGGPAANSTLNQPQGITLDAAGNIYVADVGNNRIRMISAANATINTIAGTGYSGYTGDGGTATSANLSVLDICMDGNGNLFFSDYAHNCIRKINNSTNIITTVAGTGIAGSATDGAAATSARLNSPYGLKVDINGNIFFCDKGNFTVRKVNGVTGIITTIAGTGFSGYDGNGIHATAYSLINPYGINVDLSGNIYINDAFRIREVAAN